MSFGLKEARTRLAYINQHREVTLGIFVALASLFRILGYPVPIAVLLLLTGWFAVSIAFVHISQRFEDERQLHRFELAYFVLELVLLTGLAHYTGAADWLAVMFYTGTILYANVVLSPRRGHWITLLASCCFSGLVLAEYFGRVPHVQLFNLDGARYTNGPYVLTTLLVGPVATYFLVGYTSSQFSRMLTSKAEALESANRDLKVTGSELRMHQEHLEELVRRRTQDLARAYEELRRANSELMHLNELKSSFLANVSHELRTPLTSIRSFSEILLSYPDEEPQTRTEFLGIIKSESERLTRLINDVLDLAKIEAGRIELRMQPVQLESVVRMSIEIMRGWAERKGLNADIAMDENLPLILGDPDRLIQVTTNLLNNAMKFTTQGYVRIATMQQGDEVLLAITDSGPGIPPDERDLIFEKFHQCGNTLTAKPQGTGLGLSICREIMQRHHGRIWVESEMGKGSTFICAFPVLTPPDEFRRQRMEAKIHV